MLWGFQIASRLRKMQNIVKPILNLQFDLKRYRGAILIKIRNEEQYNYRQVVQWTMD